MKTPNLQLLFPRAFLPNHSRKLSITSSLKKALQLFVQLVSGNHEPRVWTTTDPYGNIYWHAYDPTSEKSIRLSSEDEIRSWLEQRYYN